MKHGPIALIADRLPVVALAPRDASYERMLGNIEEVRARDGQVIAKPVSKYCTSETVNPWEVASTNVGLNPEEARSRTYYGLVSDLLVKLEKSL